MGGLASGRQNTCANGRSASRMVRLQKRQDTEREWF